MLTHTYFFNAAASDAGPVMRLAEHPEGIYALIVLLVLPGSITSR